MGIRLVVEVLDHAPAELTAAERLVLVVLAEHARDATREAYPGWDLLLRRTGLGVSGLRRALQRLSRRGWEVRIPLGIDAVGRPLYAFAGQRTRFRIPEFAASNGGTAVLPNGGTEDPPMAVPEYRSGGTGVPPLAVPQYRPSPQRSLSPSARAVARGDQPPAHITMIMKKTGATADEALAVADRVAVEKTPDNLPGFLRRLAADGELDEWLVRVRQDADRASESRWRAWAREQPPCEHDVAGGHEVSPTGWVACPIERRRLAAQPAAGGRS